MIFTPLDLHGAYLIDLEKKEDHRGFFSRLFCVNEIKNHELQFNCVQMNTSFSTQKGTLRGMHFQREPKLEAKIIKCIKGAIADVIIDLRKNSPTFGKWKMLELNDNNRSMMFVPEGFAHGFQTLSNNCELIYWHSNFYSAEFEGGVNYADPILNINWPLKVTEITQRDIGHPMLNEIRPINTGIS
ncbi:MAG: dTDP-4-dehydrorhamnose 3,5-epimerase [Bacteroidia bacterium]|jgi:dTDP-4-dehydrorhamnose 3,5-epimerase|nr:dTDP-4-dehydrorhamnose 3,5-epimerase [Bacteroidia bacterium]